jgi:hypothetical protein
VGGEYDVDELRDEGIVEIWRGSWKIIAEGWRTAECGSMLKKRQHR